MVVDEIWDYVLEPFKTGISKAISEWKESWNAVPAN